MVTVNVKQLIEAKEEIKQLPDRLLRYVIARMSQVSYDKMEEGARRHSKTGMLLKSLYNRKITNGREVGHDYQMLKTEDGWNRAAFILFGTRPHLIFAKGWIYVPADRGLASYDKRPYRAAWYLLGQPQFAKYLKPGWQHQGKVNYPMALRYVGGGGFKFRTWTLHPGYKGDNYMIPAMNAATEKLPEIVDAVLKNDQKTQEP